MFVAALLITCFIIWFFWALVKRPSQLFGVLGFLILFMGVCVALFFGFVFAMANIPV